MFKICGTTKAVLNVNETLQLIKLAFDTLSHRNRNILLCMCRIGYYAVPAVRHCLNLLHVKPGNNCRNVITRPATLYCCPSLSGHLQQAGTPLLNILRILSHNFNGFLHVNPLDLSMLYTISFIFLGQLYHICPPRELAG